MMLDIGERYIGGNL